MRIHTHPLRVAVLCSRRAPALRYLLTHDFTRGAASEIVACLTTEDSFADEDIVAEHGVLLMRHSIREFCRSNGWRLTDHAARTTYDAATRRRLAPLNVDVIALDTYLYVLSDPMLYAYPGRILNVHHSDLAARDRAGNARFVGLHAVRDAIFAGAPETRATVHVVTAQLDQGPPLVRSWPFPVAPLVDSALVWGAADIVKAYAYAHQEWMIRATWGPLVAATLRLLIDGRLNLDDIYENAGNRGTVPYELAEDGHLSRATDVEALRTADLVGVAR